MNRQPYTSESGGDACPENIPHCTTLYKLVARRVIIIFARVVKGLRERQWTRRRDQSTEKVEEEDVGPRRNGHVNRIDERVGFRVDLQLYKKL